MKCALKNSGAGELVPSECKHQLAQNCVSCKYSFFDGSNENSRKLSAEPLICWIQTKNTGIFTQVW